MRMRGKWRVRPLGRGIGLVLLLLLGGLSLVPLPPSALEPSSESASPEETVPSYPGARLEFEVLLTREDFLGGIERVLNVLLELTRELPPLQELLPRLEGAYAKGGQELEVLLSIYYELGRVAGEISTELARRLVAATEVFRATLSTLPSSPAEVVAFYDRHFAQAGWRRNLWVRTEEEIPIGLRLYSRSQAGSLSETALLALFPALDLAPDPSTTALLVLYARFR